MNFHVLTLFPEMIEQGFHTSITGRSLENGTLTLHAVNIRDYTINKHKKVDDYPYGGGAGMLMQAQPVYDAWKSITGGKRARTVYVTPQGQPFTQKLARELSKEEELIFLCGHYEGIDERVLEELVTDYVSIGDYVLTGGELPAMVMIDAISRLVPEVLSNDLSAHTESFHNDLLEYPQYSRPEEWHGKRVPEVLLSGNHSKIEQWRLECSKERTERIRPDLYERYLKKERLIQQLKKKKRNHIHMIENLARGIAEIIYHKGGDVLIYNAESKTCMMLAESEESARNMLELAPASTELFLTNQPFLNPMICERFSYVIYHECYQCLYTKKEHLPVDHKDIRLLTMEHLPYVQAHYHLLSGEYVEDRILNKALYGAFVENQLVGFVGLHDDGSSGMLYVDENYRRMHIGESLVAFHTNRMLEQGCIPYAHIITDNRISLEMQEKMGYYVAEQTVFWMGEA